MKPRHVSAIAGLQCMLLCGAAVAQIYDHPRNLQVLPADIGADELRDTMKSFFFGTGLRCSSCHVGEEGQPLTTYDFASDEVELKQTARQMLRMVNAINTEHLAALGPERAEVSCATCHRGERLPGD
jgi:cytochrome c